MDEKGKMKNGGWVMGKNDETKKRKETEACGIGI